MANNYQQWSQSLPLNNEEEKKWWRDVLTISYFDDGDQQDVLDFVNAKFKEWGFEEDPVKEFDDIEGWPAFEWEIDPVGVGASLWVYAEEVGDIDRLVVMVQTFFKKFRPDGVFRLTWSETCSKMRVGEFSGGAVHVDAKRILWCLPTSFFDQIDQGIIT